jgi:hypothetical protein
MDKPLLDKTQIERIFQIVDAKAAAAGRQINLFVIGGAALVLTTDFRQSTGDIDVVAANFSTPNPSENLYFLHNAVAEISRRSGFEPYHELRSDDDFQKTLLDFESSYSLGALVRERRDSFDRFPLHSGGTTGEKTYGLNVFLLNKEMQLLLKLTRANPKEKDYDDMRHLCSDLGITGQAGLQKIWDANRSWLPLDYLMEGQNMKTGKIKVKWEDIVGHDDTSVASGHRPEPPKHGVHLGRIFASWIHRASV